MAADSGWRKFFERWEAGDVNSDGDVRAYCPVHEDPATSSSPSAVFNYPRGIWNCLGAAACAEEIGGTLKKLSDHLKLTGIPKKKFDVWDEDAPTTAAPGSGKLPTEAMVQGWQESLWRHEDKMRYLQTERGLHPETVRHFGIGWVAAHGRYSIPIRSSKGTLVNVRFYGPQYKDAKKKMLNVAGHGQQQIFNLDVLQGNETVVLCEGELDTMVAWQHGLPAIGHTGGSNTWQPTMTALFKGKEVFIVYDRDDGGVNGARKVATALSKVADAFIVDLRELPYDGSDITDYFVRQGYSADSLRERMEEARKAGPYAVRPAKAPPAESGQPVSLTNSMDALLGANPVELVVTVAGKQDPPYEVPKDVHYTCTMDAGKQCQVCPMLALGGDHKDSIDPDEAVLLQFIDATNKQAGEILRERIGAKRCDRLEKEWIDKWTLEELLVTNSVEFRSEETEAPVTRRVYNVGTFKTPVNTTVKIVGRNLPDPRSQRQTFLSWRLEPTKSDLDRFAINKDSIERLKVFQPLPGQTSLKRIGDIARDLAANVTLIYGRPELHIAYDLVWHSAMDFRFQGSNIGKGWLEMIVVGDTRTGKSEVATKMRTHYEAGEVVPCEGMSFAGLIGGVQQVHNRWMITWGLVPLQDRRLVVLDEMSGLQDKDVIENMSSIRSSGIAQLTKIQTASTSARTRLVWISNPITGQTLDEITGGGMKALQDLVKNPEDVARFDLAMAAAGPEVPDSLINTTRHPKVEHVFTSELCAELVLWCWSRRAEDIKITKAVENYVLEAASAFGARYVPDPPLVQQQNVRQKLARIAVAVAMRTFSTEDGVRVLVRTEHVDAAVAFLDHVYGREAFGYKRHSERELRAKEKARAQRRDCRKFLLANEDALIGLRMVMHDSQFRVRDFVDFANMATIEAQLTVRRLHEMGMVRRRSRGYISMTPELVSVLKEMEG